MALFWQFGISMSEVVKGIYKHFKGDEVEVVGTGLHSETQEEFVVYRHISGSRSSEGHYWVRPIKMFLEEVERDGKKISRFQLIKKN